MAKDEIDLVHTSDIEGGKEIVRSWRRNDAKVDVTPGYLDKEFIAKNKINIAKLFLGMDKGYTLRDMKEIYMKSMNKE